MNVIICLTRNNVYPGTCPNIYHSYLNSVDSIKRRLWKSHSNSKTFDYPWNGLRSKTCRVKALLSKRWCL